MSEDRIRTMFRRADAVLGHAPPDLDETIAQAKRETATRRIVVGLGSAAVVVVAVIAALVTLRPDVERVVPPAATSQPSVAPCDAKDVNAFIENFMRRREDGTGAEACLSANALAQYRAGQRATYNPNDAMCLYACGPYKITGYDFMSPPQEADAHSYEAIVAVLVSQGEDTARMVEHWAIGPGTTASGDQQALVIRGAGV